MKETKSYMKSKRLNNDNIYQKQWWIPTCKLNLIHCTGAFFEGVSRAYKLEFFQNDDTSAFSRYHLV